MKRQLTKLDYLTGSDLAESYYSWLCHLINVNQRTKSYWILIKHLHDKPFKWFVPNDDNRASEARNLRERFCDETNVLYVVNDFDETISMLELIIALAYRCETIMDGQLSNIDMREWFWKLLSNAGLSKFTDENYYEYYGSIRVDDILAKIINREYQRNGFGGLFPLKRSKKDQRKVELWYQMSEYLVENYYTDDLVV